MGLETILRYYRWMLDEDRESFTDNPLRESFSGVSWSPLGTIFELVTRLGGDLHRDIVEPLLSTEEEGRSELIKAYLEQASTYSLDIHCRRYNAHLELLRSLEILSNPDEIAGIDATVLREWIIEAYSVVSIGFPSDVERSVLRNPQFERPDLSAIRLARSKSSSLVKAAKNNMTLEQEVSRRLGIWSFSDGIPDIIAFYPDLRNQLIQYVTEFLDLKYKTLKHLLKEVIRVLVSYMIDVEKEKAG